MSLKRIFGHNELTRTHKISAAGVATLGAAALAITLVPGHDTQAQAQGEPTSSAAQVAFTNNGVKDLQASVTNQQAAASQKAKLAAELKSQQKADAKKAADAKAKADAEAKAAKDRAVREAASRSAARKPVYANNLDGWIKESLSIMKSKGIPGSYDGLHRNIMRESSGNPKAINGWDINAINGIPSKGLLQVIPPTFNAYHVSGTPKDIYDPVANITAAANYAADKYGSIDNVNSAY
jgi:membrane protein involved in colicin uptake